MDEKINKVVWDRAKTIFEKEAPIDEQWGALSKDGKIAYGFTERTNLSQPTRTIIGDGKRSKYLKRAYDELVAEGKIPPK